MSLAEIITWSLVIGAAIALISIIRSYAKGLRGSPRELWLLYGYKFCESMAYGATNLMLVVWLSAECRLSDVNAGWFITCWSLGLSAVAMAVGALVDTVGIRKVCLLSVVMLITARCLMSWITVPENPSAWHYLPLVFCLLPLAVGFAIVAPAVSVGVKHYTNKETSALGFSLFYVIMNLGISAGSFILDAIRTRFAVRNAAGGIIDPNAGMNLLGVHFSTNQLVFVFGGLATLMSLVAVCFLREGVVCQPGSGIVIQPRQRFVSIREAVVDAVRNTAALMKAVFREKYFWIFLGLIGVTCFVRLVFFNFQYTFPKYCLRVLGEGAKYGTLYGFLNPVLIVFLVPTVAFLTRKTDSFRMLVIGAFVSASSCFIFMIPASWFAGLNHSVIGEIIFVHWLGLAENASQLPQVIGLSNYWPIIIAILCFTVGEAIWSPRLVQFTAQIAPKGKESTYIAMSALPFFVTKSVIGPLSGNLLDWYTPIDEKTKAVLPHPDHAMIWVWVGAMAVLTPIGLMIFRSRFPRNTSASETA